MPFNSRPNSKSKDFTRYANMDACLKCHEKNKCTTGKYRTVKDRPLVEYSREVDKLAKANMQMYHKRKQLVEHPFGTVKRALGFSYFLTRGNDNVRTESLLHFLVYNMKRAINQIGTRQLIEVL